VDQALSPERTEQTPPPAGLYQLEPGDPVRLLNLNQRGVLLEKPRPGKEVAPVGVGVGGVRVLVPLNEMAPLPPGDKPQAEPTRVSVWAEAGAGLDLKLIGLRVDDALPLVDKALDQAILSGRDSMRIVHGGGAGRLRQAGREYLRNHPQVVRARSPEGRGSAGVTVAELRR
jgi:DNA mismatch repair protein MutS2